VLCFVFVLGFSGCGFMSKLLGGDDETEQEMKGSVIDAHNIKAKLGITETGVKGVMFTFNALHDFIQNGGLDGNVSGVFVALGDWIDLEDGLTVADFNGVGDFTAVGGDESLRLIVAGINSFQSNADNGYTYQGTTPPSRVMFQFQNIPVMRRMNEGPANIDGYSASEMRKYLVPVESVSGKFLDGLETAGMPLKVLWAPARVVYGTSTIIEDKLWLPTDREMYRSKPDNPDEYRDCGQVIFSTSEESAENQARLEYYTDETSRKKVWAGGKVEVLDGLGVEIRRRGGRQALRHRR
jgi:hypothetical protein